MKTNRNEVSVSSVEHIEKPGERRKGWTEIIIGRQQIGQNCSLALMMQLIEVSQNRVDIDVNFVDWARLVERHIKLRESKRENPWSFGTGNKERCLLYHAIKFKQYFLVRALLEANASPDGSVN